MSIQIPKCKITILKRTIHQDLIKEYLTDDCHSLNPCERFQDGQEFVLESEVDFQKVPEGFCDWAWADIRKDVLFVAFGGNMPGYKERGMAITGCSDWFRPVIFKVERMKDD